MVKQNCYEHSIRVPLVMAGPGIPEGNQNDGFVYILDVYRTLCGLIGFEVPASVEGISLVPALNNPEERVREHLYFAYVSSQRAVKSRQYKLIEYCPRDRDHQTQLFDIEADPWELTNLAADHPNVVAELRAVMNNYREDWEAGHTERSARFWERYAH